MEANRATTASIRELLHAYDPGSELLDVARPGQGLANAVYFLRTSRFNLVLKVFDDEAGAWKPQKEIAIHGLMGDLDIPAPGILLVDSSKAIVPFVYSLLERVAGEAYSRVLPSLSMEDNARIYRQLGDCLGRLHTTTFGQFGDVCRSGGELVVGPAHELGRDAEGRPHGPFATWLEMHRAIVAHRLSLMRGTAFEDLIPAVERWFERCGDVIDIEIVPRLLHMDLHPGNVLVRDGHVVAILDVEESIVGHNEYDLMRTELGNFRDQPPEYERAFMASYTSHVVLDAGYLARKPFYDLSRTLAWICSLIRHGDRYDMGPAAHAHVLALTAGARPG